MIEYAEFIGYSDTLYVAWTSDASTPKTTSEYHGWWLYSQGSVLMFGPSWFTVHRGSNKRIAAKFGASMSPVVPRPTIAEQIVFEAMSKRVPVLKKAFSNMVPGVVKRSVVKL